MSAFAASVWRFRALVERQAATRFAGLANALVDHGFAALSPIAARAAADERRHAALCEQLAQDLGADPLEVAQGWQASRLAPKRFGAREALIYDVVAQCCVAETESMATLSTLMETMAPSRFRQAVHEIARDEVVHARLGWALLEQLAAADAPPRFLQGHLVAMCSAGAAALYRPAPAGADDPDLIAYGVLPHALKRTVFEQALREVIVPGLSRAGLDCEEIRGFPAN